MTSQLFQPIQSGEPGGIEPEAQGQLDLNRFVAALKRGKWIIAGMTVTVAAAAVARAFLSPPTYEASFEILIQPSSAETEVVSSVSEFSTNQAQRTISLKDQVRILESPGVLEPAVEAMLRAYPDFCRPAETEVSSDLLRLEEQRQQCGYSIIDGGLNVSLLEEKTNSTEGSRIFRARYSADSEQFAQDIAYLVAETYLEYGLASRQRDIQQALAFLDTKLPDVRGRVTTLQAQLQTLRQENNLINPEARGEQLSDQIGEFSRDYLQVRVELEERLKLAEDLQQQLSGQPQDAAVSPYLSSNRRYQSIVEELLALDSEITEASTLFRDSSPDMQVLQERRSNLLALLAREGNLAQQELLSELNLLQTREAALASTLNGLNVDVNNLAALSRRYSDIERDLGIATANLDQLLQKQESLELEAAQRELPWEMITPPKVKSSVESLPKNALLGTVIGLLLGVGIALFRDTLKDTLHTPQDIKRVTPVPILGLVPYYESVSEHFAVSTLAVNAHENGRATSPTYSNGSAPTRNSTAFREAFRTLLSNIRQIATDNPICSIVISSAAAQEGKTTTAANLAQAAAAMGERVLLVDGNLRSPGLHSHFSIPNQQGFVEALTSSVQLKNLVQQSLTEPNLYFLTAGETNIDPARILSAKSIQRFIARVDKSFDLVIFDTTSVLEYADAQLITAQTDGMILVSNLGQLKSTQLEQTLERLWISKIAVLGIVAREESPRHAFQFM